MKKINMGWFTGVGLVAMLLAIGNLIYTCTRNSGEKYVQQYIDESEYVTLHIPEGIKDVTYRAGSISNILYPFWNMQCNILGFHQV